MLKMGTMCGRVTRRVCSGRWLSGQLTCEASSSSWRLLSRCAGPSTSFPRSLFALWLHLATAQALIYLDYFLASAGKCGDARQDCGPDSEQGRCHPHERRAVRAPGFSLPRPASVIAKEPLTPHLPIWSDWAGVTCRLTAQRSMYRSITGHDSKEPMQSNPPERKSHCFAEKEIPREHSIGRTQSTILPCRRHHYSQK
jgi:hypothetical protein